MGSGVTRTTGAFGNKTSEGEGHSTGLVSVKPEPSGGNTWAKWHYTKDLFDKCFPPNPFFFIREEENVCELCRSGLWPCIQKGDSKGDGCETCHNQTCSTSRKQKQRPKRVRDESGNLVERDPNAPKIRRATRPKVPKRAVVPPGSIGNDRASEVGGLGGYQGGFASGSRGGAGYRGGGAYPPLERQQDWGEGSGSRQEEPVSKEEPRPVEETDDDKWFREFKEKVKRDEEASKRVSESMQAEKGAVEEEEEDYGDYGDYGV